MASKVAPPLKNATTAASDFDHLPYPSLPQSYTQPARLAAMAQLHGLTAPPAATARVLELGCASGGNIVPLAVRFPEAHFVGIDLSTRHISDGQRRIAALGLRNVELHAGDVTTLTFEANSFDYIVCHGLFSWVPKVAQDAILQICRDRLAPNGVAAISYNVLPGWHFRRVIRDICLRAAGQGTARERAVRARGAIEDIAKSSNKQLSYGYFLRQESMRLSGKPLAYIYGEFLSEHNTPFTLPGFARRAAGYDMKFLCESDLDASAMRAIEDPVQFSKLLPPRDEHFAIGRGEALDYASGRPFRRSLIVHSAAGTSTQMSVDVAKLRGLHVTGTEGKSHLATVDRAFPSSIAVDGLIAGLAAADAQRVGEVVLAMVTTEQASLSTLPVRAGRADASKPSVSALNRIEAASGQPWLSNLHHDGVPLSAARAALVRHLDGTRDRAGLAAGVASTGLEDGQSPAEFIDATLAYLELKALLLTS
jgi:SAM-dependent methyltransferase